MRYQVLRTAAPQCPMQIDQRVNEMKINSNRTMMNMGTLHMPNLSIT